MVRIAYLRELVTLAETRNFTEAAKRCHLSQSSMSKHIAAIEASLGVDLLVRPSNPIVFTKAGYSLVQDSKTILFEWDETAKRTKAISESSTQELRLGYYLPVSRWVLDDIHTWTQRNGERFSIHPMSLTPIEIEAALLEKRIDAGITIDPSGNLSQTCNYLCLKKERLMLAVGKKNPLAKHDVVHIADLSNEVFFRPPLGYWPTVSVHLEQIFGRLHNYAHGRFLDDIETVLISVESNMGIAMVLEHNRSNYGDRIRFIDVQEELDEHYTVPMGLFWLKESEESYTKRSQICYLKTIFKYIREKHSID